ncbi:hypothetical protein [Methanobrevibacter sp.]|uniref:hypothetical protein n=1 Tax=Methanobrevibacter sp. TaxID=66852 RepID=UPI00386E6644
MRFDLAKYSVEIVEFLCAKTLEEIDYGILDLSHVRNHELKEVLIFLEELLTIELKVNYLKNDTGLFRVHVVGNKYCYNEFGYVLEADSLCELKELVLGEDRIWYVFDEISARELIEERRGLNAW